MIFPTEAAYRAYLQDVKDFLWHVIDPLVPQIEHDELIPFDMLRPQFREHHLFDCLVPEAYGGLGLTTEQYAPVLKELAKVHGGLRAMLHVHNSSVHLMETGRVEQRQRYIPRMATGDLLVCFGLTEPDSGSGLDSQSHAVRQGDVYLLHFDNVPVPVANVLGREGLGSAQLLAFLEISRVFIAVAALGTAERALELALEWAKQRVTFGKPIAERQAV